MLVVLLSEKGAQASRSSGGKELDVVKEGAPVPFWDELRLHHSCDSCPGGEQDCWCIPFIPRHKANCLCTHAGAAAQASEGKH